MDEDLDEVKDQLDQLSETLERMKDTTERAERSEGPVQDTGSGTGKREDTEKPDTSPEQAGKDDIDDYTGQDPAEEGDEDTHPSDIGRFRDKLDHGHEAADQEHFREAQRIYRSLIQEYRGLKHEDKLTENDEQRLHTLYEKVNRAKE